MREEPAMLQMMCVLWRRELFGNYSFNELYIRSILVAFWFIVVVAWIQDDNTCLDNLKSGDADATHVNESDSPDTLLCHEDSVLSNTVSGLSAEFSVAVIADVSYAIFLSWANSIFFFWEETKYTKQEKGKRNQKYNRTTLLSKLDIHKETRKEITY